MQKEILIIGAGPAGMACAMELHNASKQTFIVEKEDTIGGLAKTLQFKEGELLFRTDIGPHRFFSKNKYLYNFIENLLDEKWMLVNRQTRQLIEGKFYDYPINAMQAFKNIGLYRSILMGYSYFIAFVQYHIFRKKVVSFEDYIIKNFGKKLGNFNMLNYTEKIWGIPCNTIHPDWATQRIKGLNVISALKNALFPGKKINGPKTLVDSFYYPQYGTGLIYETIASKIKATGSIIETQSYPVQINHNGKKIISVELQIKNKKEIIEPDNLVSSIPITEFIKILNPLPPQEVLNTLNKLKWRAQVYLFITLDKKSITNDNWIYFPDLEIPFGRIAEMKNFSIDMSPIDKTSLFIEYFVTEGDKIWNATKDELLEISIPFFEKSKLFTREEIRNYYLIKRNYVYPIYDLHYKENIKIIKDYLNLFDNLFYIGRPGRFQYNNQDHSLEMGILAAKSILDGKKYDMDLIGAENDYFEKGEIRKA